jgi:hypothetical protein
MGHVPVSERRIRSQDNCSTKNRVVDEGLVSALEKNAAPRNVPSDIIAEGSARVVRGTEASTNPSAEK